MLKYKIISKDQNSTAEYFGDASMMEQIVGWLEPQIFGLPERPEIDAEGNPTGNILPAEYTVQITDITAELEQERINAEALKYLADTDWMIIRELDANIPCPADVKLARAEARAKIVRNV